MRICSKCRIQAGPSFFKKKTNICKKCISEYNREYRKQNKSRLLQNSKDEYQRNKDKYKIRAHQYYLDNKEKLIEYSENYRKAHPEGVSLACKKWRKANPDKRIEYQQRREFKKKNNGRNDLTAKQIGKLRREQLNCLYCGIHEIRLTIDHVIPISKGGENTIDNVVLACGPCNSSKSNNTLQERHSRC